MTSDAIIRGAVFGHPAGAAVWQCDVCHWPFLWSPRASAYCNGADEPLAVVCSEACKAKLDPPTRSDRTIAPIGQLGADGMARGRPRLPLPPGAAAG